MFRKRSRFGPRVGTLGATVIREVSVTGEKETIRYLSPFFLDSKHARFRRLKPFLFHPQALHLPFLAVQHNAPVFLTSDTRVHQAGRVDKGAFSPLYAYLQSACSHSLCHYVLFVLLSPVCPSPFIVTFHRHHTYPLLKSLPENSAARHGNLAWSLPARRKVNCTGSDRLRWIEFNQNLALSTVQLSSFYFHTHCLPHLTYRLHPLVPVFSCPSKNFPKFMTRSVFASEHVS